MPIYLPPLRERREDIPPLVDLPEALRRAEPPRGPARPPRGDAAARDHDWPGNVRELENYVERAVVLGDGAELTVELPPLLAARQPPPIRAAAATWSP